MHKLLRNLTHIVFIISIFISGCSTYDHTRSSDEDDKPPAMLEQATQKEQAAAQTPPRPWLDTKATSGNTAYDLLGAVEIGGKGIKALLIKYDNSTGGVSSEKIYERTIDTTVVGNIKNGNKLPVAAAQEVADATNKLLLEMHDKSSKYPDAKIAYFIAISSGVATKIVNIGDLVKTVSENAGIPADVITPADEAEYGFYASVPHNYRKDSIFIDVGSSNTKASFLAGNGMNTFEIPFGSKTLHDEATKLPLSYHKAVQKVISDKVVSIIKTNITSSSTARNKKIVCITGGAAWALATYTRQESHDKRNLIVKISRKDVAFFISNLKRDRWGGPQYKDKSKAAMEAADKEMKSVADKFSTKQIYAGVSILNASIAATRPTSHIVFINKMSPWLNGYLNKKYVYAH